jgi:hypothetical protein
LFDGNRIFATNNVITLSKDFGDQSEIFNGVDVGVNARLPRGVAVSGGTSTGRVPVWRRDFSRPVGKCTR